MLDSPLFSIIRFVLVAWVVFNLIATIGGWRKLAASYATSRQSGARTRQSGSVGPWRLQGYNNILHVKATESGLYLATNRLFSVGHKPLLIPWTMVTWRGHSRVLLASAIKLDISVPVDGAPPVKLRLKSKNLERYLSPWLHAYGVIEPVPPPSYD